MNSTTTKLNSIDTVHAMTYRYLSFENQIESRLDLLKTEKLDLFKRLWTEELQKAMIRFYLPAAPSLADK